MRRDSARTIEPPQLFGCTRSWDMRTTAIETIHVEAYPNITFVEVHTDEGLIGLGETFRTPKAIAAQIHETVAPYLLGKNPLAIDSHSNALLNSYLGFGSSSVETRAASAVDIALWDLWGKGARPSGPRAAGWPLA